MKIKQTLPVAVLVLTALTIPGRATAAEGRFERDLKVTGAVDLDVKTGSGDIRVRPGAAGTVRVIGRIQTRREWLGGDAEQRVRRLESNPPIEQSGNTIKVGHIEDRELTNNVSISYELTVPAETRLRSQTGSGDQKIEGVRGPVEASSGSGDLSISDIGDEVRASAGSGDIKVSSINGKVRAASGSGDIRATGIAGPVTAASGSGDVTLEQTASGGAEVKTGSGDIEVAGIRGPLRVRTGSGKVRAEGEPAEEWDLEAGSGNVSLRLPQQAAFDFHGRTTSGHISISHPLSAQGVIGRREMQGKVRGGGVLVYVKTGSGNIEVE